jgi:hypothetical protein
VANLLRAVEGFWEEIQNIGNDGGQIKDIRKRLGELSLPD